MARRRRLVLAVALVAIAALLLAGTSYARSLASPGAREAEPVAGCGNVAMGNMTGSMHGGTGAGQDMDAMHESMHGSDEASGGSCHEGETGGSMMGGGMGKPGRSMMGQQL